MVKAAGGRCNILANASAGATAYDLVDFSYAILPFLKYSCRFVVIFLINPRLIGSKCPSASLSFCCWRDHC